MPLRWTNSGQGPYILELLNELTGLNQDGNVTLGWGGKFEIYIDILSGYIDFSKNVPNKRRVQITRRAVVDAKKGGRLDAETVLSLTHEAQAEFLRRPKQEFVLLASASVKHGKHLRQVRFDASTIAFLPTRPESFALPDGGSLIVRDDTPDGYCYIKAYVSARDPMEAGELAFDDIDSLRSIWNLSLNSRTIERRSLGRQAYKPVNRIILGPIHTLHTRDGTHAYSNWWYSTLPTPIPAYDLSPDIEQVKRNEAFIRKQVRRCAFGDRLLGFVRQYGRALDEFDLNNSLLRLWSVLEHITGPPKGTYDVLIRRISFIWDDYEETRVVLNYLRDHRNELVHAGSNPADIERLLYQLKEYVEATLWFLIRQAHRFATMQDLWTFLDLPPNLDELKGRLRQHRRAIAFRSKSEEE